MAGERGDMRACVRETMLPTLGLAVAVALYGLAVWAPSALLGGTPGDTGRLLCNVSSVAHALGLVVFGLADWRLARRCEPAARSRALAALACALPLACMALWATAFLLGAGCGSAVSLAAGVVTGVCASFAFVWWVSALARLDARARHAALAAAAALGSVLSLGAALPLVLRRVAVLVLLAGSCALALACTHGRGVRPVGATIPPAGGDVPPARRGLAAELAPVVVTSVVVSFAAPFVNGVLMLDALPMPSRVAVSTCMGLACAATLAAIWLLPRRGPSTLKVLLAFTIVLFAAFLLNGALDLRLSIVVLALSSAGYFLVLYLLMEACVGTSARYGASVTAVYGAAGCVVMLSRVVADDLSLRLLHAGVTEEMKTLVAMFLMVYLLTCAGFALYHALTRPRAAAPVPAPVPSSPATPPAADATTRRCELVGARCGLSPRELQVLVLMMHGRNVPAIAEELSISRNTVQTHVRHVYEALGVHGRQELVTRVEACPLE